MTAGRATVVLDVGKTPRSHIFGRDVRTVSRYGVSSTARLTVVI